MNRKKGGEKKEQQKLKRSRGSYYSTASFLWNDMKILLFCCFSSSSKLSTTLLPLSETNPHISAINYAASAMMFERLFSPLLGRHWRCLKSSSSTRSECSHCDNNHGEKHVVMVRPYLSSHWRIFASWRKCTKTSTLIFATYVQKMIVSASNCCLIMEQLFWETLWTSKAFHLCSWYHVNKFILDARIWRT